MGEDGDAEQQQHARQGAERIQPCAGQAHPPGEPQQRPAARHTDREPGGHLPHELAADMNERARADSACGDQARHQRDPHRVVRARLPLQDNPGPAGDLPLAQDGEHHRRIGRRDRRGHEQRHIPGQAERQMRQQRRGDHGQERAQHPGHGDRDSRRPDPRPADVHAAVEQNAGQGHGHHPRHGLLRGPVHGRDDLGSDRRTHQEQRRSGELDPVSQPIRQHCAQPHRGYHHYQQRKRLSIGHDGAPPGQSRLTDHRPGFPAHHSQP